MSADDGQININAGVFSDSVLFGWRGDYREGYYNVFNCNILLIYY